MTAMSSARLTQSPETAPIPRTKPATSTSLCFTRDEAIPEHELVARVAAGDPAAFGTLYDRHAQTVFAIGLSLLHDASAAEDLRQETFLRFWLQARSYRAERGAFPAWLYRIARNLALDQLRRQSRLHAVALDRTAQSDLAIDARQDIECIAVSRIQCEIALAAMDRLPATQRQAVELAYLGGWSHQRIATALGEPLGTVKSRISLGAAKIRAALASGAAP